MNARKALVVGALAAALTIPAGAAVAATSGAGPAPGGPAPASGGADNGPGRAGAGTPREDCPRYNSAEMQKWRAGREERQAQMRKLHGSNWTPPRNGTGPFHDRAPGARPRQS